MDVYEKVFLLGDSAYPCRPWLLTPYRNAQTVCQRNYNKALSKTRVVIETTFGRWKRRFHSMHGELRFPDPGRACQVIVATAILHNISIRRNVPQAEENQQMENEEVIPDDAEGLELPDYDEQAGPAESGRAFRDHIAQTLFNV